MTQTTHLALPLIDAAQSQKHVTHNEALAVIDAVAHLAVSARVTSPPATPNEGDRVLIAAGAADAFAGKEQRVATFLAGAWSFLSPQPGWRLYVVAESLLLLYDGADWVDLGASLHELRNLTLLGVGTTADAANPISAKINAALFAAKTIAEGGNGDLRLALNKEIGANTASLLYQSNYSGRAEAGLTGNNDYRVKVSIDGATWKDAIVVDRNTGGVTFPSGGPAKIQTFATSGVYTPTPGMRFADLILFGAGGGGASGARRAAGAIASGGGGGGGGGVARGRFTSAQIGASRTVAIGAAGTGGASQTANDAAGVNGVAGGDTAFGVLLKAYGGGAGAGGQLAGPSGGGGGSSYTDKGGNASGAIGGIGAQGAVNGGSGAAGAGSFYAGFGTGGGGSPASGGIGNQGGNSLTAGAAGGGSGGGVTGGNAVSNGGFGGVKWPGGIIQLAVGGAAGGPVDGAAGYGNFPQLDEAGTGGGGGASGLTTAGAGGAGGFPGGGGGGGGASQNGALSGAGGAGGAGFAIVIEYF